jgi:hypothetical protein
VFAESFEYLGEVESPSSVRYTITLIQRISGAE